MFSLYYQSNDNLWRHCIVKDFIMASVEDKFAVAPCSFQQEYAEGEESSNSSSDADLSSHIEIMRQHTDDQLTI